MTLGLELIEELFSITRSLSRKAEGFRELVMPVLELAADIAHVPAEEVRRLRTLYTTSPSESKCVAQSAAPRRPMQFRSWRPGVRGMWERLCQARAHARRAARVAMPASRCPCRAACVARTSGAAWAFVRLVSWPHVQTRVARVPYAGMARRSHVV
jgi:hypothetical protein